MKKGVKIALWSIAALFLLLIIGLTVLVIVINPNDYKPQITAQVQKATGREFAINGDIGWSFFPWIGLSLEGVTLGNPAGFNPQIPFATVKEADVSVQLLPLLTGDIEIGKIELIDPTLHLTVLKNSRTNFDFSQPSSNNTQSTTATEALQPPEATETPNINIAHLQIDNAHIIWDNQRDGQYVDVTDLDLSANHIGLDRLFPVTLSFNANSKNPDLFSHVTLDGKLMASPQKQHYQLSSLDFSFETKGKINLKATKGIADMDLQWNDANQAQKLLLRQLHGEGDLRIDDVVFNKIHLTKLVFKLHAKSGKLALDPMKANLYDGVFNSSINIDATGDEPQFKITESLKDVNVGDLLKDTTGKEQVSGQFQLQLNANTRGDTQTTFLRNMQGKGSFELDKGILHGIDINEQLQLVNQFIGQGFSRKPVKSKRLGGQVVFTQLNGTFQINQGVLRNEDFVLRSNEFNTTGKGSVDLLPQTIQYRLLVGPGTSGNNELFGEFTKIFGDSQIPILINGTLSDPTISPDWDLLQKKLIQEKGGKLLDDATKQLKKWIKF